MTRDGACRTRQDRAVAWTVAHAGELAGVGAPLIAGAVWTPWLDLGSVVVGLAWLANELRLHRTTRPARATITTAGTPPRELAAVPPRAERDRKEERA